MTAISRISVGHRLLVLVVLAVAPASGCPSFGPWDWGGTGDTATYPKPDDSFNVWTGFPWYDNLDECDEWSRDCEEPVPGFAAIQFRDDPTNPTLVECDAGTMNSPGADIDAAELGAGTYLTNCTLDGDLCKSTAGNAGDAEGPSDSVGGEQLDIYASLNGGMLRCEWDDGATVIDDDTDFVIYEVGDPNGKVVESYFVRLCAFKDGSCEDTPEVKHGSGRTAFEASQLF